MLIKYTDSEYYFISSSVELRLNYAIRHFRGSQIKLIQVTNFIRFHKAECVMIIEAVTTKKKKKVTW